MELHVTYILRVLVLFNPPPSSEQRKSTCLLNIMPVKDAPVTIMSYTGVNPARQEKAPAVNTAQRKESAKRQKEKDQAFDRAVQDLLMDQIIKGEQIALEHGRSTDFVIRKLLSLGLESKTTRGPNAKNGWLSQRMKELNTGMSIPMIKEANADSMCV